MKPTLDLQEIGKRIRYYRQQNGFTQETLAEAVDLSTSFIGHIEHGTRTASMDTFVKIADVLDLSLDVLLRGTSDIAHHEDNLHDRASIINRIVQVLSRHFDEWF